MIVTEVETQRTAKPVFIRDQYLSQFVPKVDRETFHTACVLLGSFSFHKTILEVGRFFQSNGIQVLAPRIEELSGALGDFGMLTSDWKILQEIEKVTGKLDKRRAAGLIERIFLLTINEADLVYIVDLPKGEGRDGYVGDTVAGEVGWAMGARKRIYALQPLEHEIYPSEGLWSAVAPTIDSFAPNEVVKMAKRKMWAPTLNEYSPDYVFGNWQPNTEACKIFRKSLTLIDE